MRAASGPLALFLGAGSFVTAKSCSRECSVEALQRFAPSHATVLTAEEVPENGSYGQGLADLSYPIDGTFLPEMCAAIVNVTSSPTSSFTFGLYLPLEWEKRFMQVGNGAFAGGINWLDMVCTHCD